MLSISRKKAATCRSLKVQHLETIMNRLLVGLNVIALTAMFAYQATSDEPQQPQRVLDNPFGELRRALTKAYQLHLEEYRDAGPTPDRVIRVNQELYEIERQVKIVGKEREAQEKYVARSQAIEELANARLANGTGSKLDVIDAQAARLMAELVLYRAAKNR